MDGPILHTLSTAAAMLANRLARTSAPTATTAYRMNITGSTWPVAGVCPGCEQHTTLQWKVDTAPADTPPCSGREQGTTICAACVREFENDPAKRPQLAAKVWRHTMKLKGLADAA